MALNRNHVVESAFFVNRDYLTDAYVFSHELRVDRSAFDRSGVPRGALDQILKQISEDAVRTANQVLQLHLCTGDTVEIKPTTITIE